MAERAEVVMRIGGNASLEDLELVVLALRLVSRNEPDVPDTLRAYLARVVSEAVRLAAHPDTLGPDTSPEAISLAFEIFESADLRGSIESSDGSPGITPELAAEFLKRMDRTDVRSG